MAAEIEVEEETAAERELQEECGRQYCTNEVYAEMLFPVQIGDYEEAWCPDCVDAEFEPRVAELEAGDVQEGRHPVVGAIVWIVLVAAVSIVLTAVLFSILLV